MPPKKISLGDIPNNEFVKKKDETNGRWIECGLCCLVIKVRATYGFTEWVNHCESSRHCQFVADQNDTGGMQKLTSFFDIKEVKNKFMSPVSPKSYSIKKSKLTNPCPGFTYGKNPELLQLYNKYKKDDKLNNSILIHCRNGVWSVHAKDCSNEAVTARQGKRSDKRACIKCYEFEFIQLVKDRVGRMDKIFHIEQYITEPTVSTTGLIEVGNFLRGNVTNASPATLVLRERCAKYISHQAWLKRNMNILHAYEAIDKSGKIHHQTWLSKVAKMYIDEPSMKTSLLHALIEFTLSRYRGDITAPASPKLIGFFQTLYALNPSIYRFFSKNLGAYNEKTIQRMNAKQSSDIPIQSCEFFQ